MENQYILLYSTNKNEDNKRETFNSFLPLDLLQEDDKNLFDFLLDPTTESSLSSNRKQIPISKEQFKDLIKLDFTINNITVNDLFINNKLEEWIL
jgi:hypothetical protein